VAPSAMSAGNAGFPAASAELRLDPLARLRRLVSGTAAIARVELQKLRHDNLDVFTRSVQPLLWLFVFGTALRHARTLAAGHSDYRAYIAPGVMAQAALFVAIFYGLAIIWERDLGQLQRLLATPLPRLGIVLGKASGAAVRAIVQASVLLAVLAAARIHLRWTPQGVLGSVALLALGTVAFACLSMVLASLLRTRERFMGIGQLVTMPLFFASSALYPLSIMPGWLQALARVNPLTYEVHGMRDLLLGISSGGTLWVDFAVTLGFCAVLAGAAARLYPRAIL
jgi:ABC-2 type transport system permease protein